MEDNLSSSTLTESARVCVHVTFRCACPAGLTRPLIPCLTFKYSYIYSKISNPYPTDRLNNPEKLVPLIYDQLHNLNCNVKGELN